MTNKTVTMPRELIEEVVAQLDDFITGDVLERLKSVLAAPVVERQPVAWIKPDVAATLRRDECCYAFGEQNPKGTLIPLYASPSGSVVPSLWEIRVRDEPDNPESPCEYVYASSVAERDSILRRGGASVFAEYACLDKVKELNQ